MLIVSCSDTSPSAPRPTPETSAGSWAGRASRVHAGAGAVAAGGAGVGAFERVVLTDSEVCDAAAYVSQRKRLDIYMMVDDSGSMLPVWRDTVEAIDSFLSDRASAGIGVGVNFFGSSCKVAAYSRPSVEIAPLPGNVRRLRQAFPGLPLEDTATLPAMRGAIEHARSWALAHPEAQTVVLLVTDGEPDGCGSTVANVTETARAGFMGSPSISTFVIGIGNIRALDAFAAAGGTGKALRTAPGAGAELINALNQVRSAALPCDFELPTAAGVQVDPDRVNLRHIASDGTETNLGAVTDRASCDPLKGGWYFDRPSAPTRVITCESSCQRLNKLGGEVKVLLGCPTTVIPPD